MSREDIKSFIEELYQSRDMFLTVNGVANATDINYMLVSDVVTEHSELFADVIKEEMATKSYTTYKRSANALRA